MKGGLGAIVEIMQISHDSSFSILLLSANVFCLGGKGNKEGEKEGKGFCFLLVIVGGICVRESSTMVNHQTKKEG